jgi:hypothetical protein
MVYIWNVLLLVNYVILISGEVLSILSTWTRKNFLLYFKKIVTKWYSSTVSLINKYKKKRNCLQNNLVTKKT